MERTLVRMLHEAAERYGNRAYTTSKTSEGWTPCSFAQADHVSDAVAAALLGRGFKPQQTFAILSEGHPQWVAFELGVIKARCVSVPLSIKLTPDEIAFRVNHSEAVGFAISGNTLGNVSKAVPMFERMPLFIYLYDMDDKIKAEAAQHGWTAGVEYVTWDMLMAEGETILASDPQFVANEEASIDEDDVVNICYTSGTTGNPKGIMLTHLNYWANSHDAVQLFELPDGVYETLIVLPVDHSFAHTVGIYTALLKGITLHFVDARGSNASIIRNFPKNLVEVNPTFLMTVPSISGNFMKKITQGVHAKGPFIEGIFNRGLAAGIKRNGDGFNKGGRVRRARTWLPYTLANVLVFPKLRRVFGSKIQYCVGGGALLEAKQQHFFAAIGVPVYQGYGLTEAAPIISSNSPKRYKFGSSGMVAPSVTCKIMKDDQHEAAVNERGEIVIKGDNVMKGYFKNEQASAEVLRDGWLWTGDLGYYDEDGFLVVTGRAKALLIGKDGEKYSPEEIEEVMINNCDVINQLVVYNDHQAITTALVTLQEDVVKQMVKVHGIKDPQKLLDMLYVSLNQYVPLAQGIPTVWHPARFAIIPKAFSEADGLVNSTMKLVRYKTIEFYKDRIDAMYKNSEQHDAMNLDALKTLFF